MKFLGVDFGLKKIGLAYSEGLLAQPLKVVTFRNPHTAIGEIRNIIKEMGIDKVIIGIPDAKIASRQKTFVKALKSQTDIKVELEDETLSSKNAQNLLINLNLQRKKRKKLEDAISAALILDSYLSKNA